jgi:hypothetical protein
MLEYKREINVLGPVVIKMDQMEVHAIFHEDWDVVVTCPACPDKFAVGGPHLAFPSPFTKERVTKDLLSLLADDHSYGRIHQNSYSSWG